MRNLKSFVLFLIFVLVLVAVAWVVRTQFRSSENVAPASSEAVPAHAGPPDIYPDPVRTPGATNPDITQENIRETICNPRWSTKSIRPDESYTHRLKIEQIEYGYSDSRLRDYEEDHFIPLELGGNPTDSEEFWPPEPFETSIPDAGAHAKDKVENYLHAEACSGEPDAGPGAARNCGGLVPRLSDVRAALRMPLPSGAPSYLHQPVQHGSQGDEGRLRRCHQLEENKAMTGLQYVTDEKGRKIAVQIDLTEARGTVG